MDQNNRTVSTETREDLPTFGNPTTDMNQPYQPTFQYPAQSVAPQQPATHPEVDECVNSAFGKGLAAAIMAEFPIASILAIVFGSKALKLHKKANELGAAYGVKVSGKNTAAKILGMIGKIAGIVMTCFWAFYFLIMVIYAGLIGYLVSYGMM